MYSIQVKEMRRLLYKIKRFFRRIGRWFKRQWHALTSWLTGGKRADEEELFPANGGRGERRPYDTGETRLFNASEGNDHQEHEPLFTERVRRRPFILSLLFTTVRFLLIGVVLAGIAVLGAGIGIARTYIETAPMIDVAQLTRSARTSFIYDKDGELITTLADIEYRDWVDIENIPLKLQQAFIAVEDIRFYKHSGVDFKRLFSAALEIFGNKTASGGSTITQQLIKNKILDNERTYKRKIQEAYLALELEKEISKDDILEAYLNDIHLGESNYGVKTAAMDYYGKELDALTNRECAMLASITQNPAYYNPRRNKYQRAESYWEALMTRTDRVLGNMYEAGFITKEEYEEALTEDVHIMEVSAQRQMYDMPYFVEYAIYDVVTHMLEQRELEDTKKNRETIENELRTGGYHIHTTVDTEMQHLVQGTIAGWEEYPKLQDPSKGIKTEQTSAGKIIETVEPQAAAVVLDYHSGELRAIIGGREEPTILKGLNRAYQSHMEVGSSIKPLAVYGPALDRGASPATIIANFPAPIDGWNTEQGYPYIGGSQWIGPTTIRRGITSSLNVVAARTLFEWVTTDVGAQYLREFGASKVNPDGPGLALGTSGLTAIQMAAAYGTIAAGGEYKEPLSFTRVLDGQGNVLLDADEVRETKQVYKTSTAYLLVDMLTEAVGSGTGTNAKIKGMTVAGKTGTNADYASVYFAGMTPYYSASLWIGHDDPSNKLLRNTTGGSYAAPLWQAFMSEIHDGLADKSIIDESPASLGLVRRTTCAVSGLLATDACHADQTGHTPVTDWMLEANAPTESCNMHVSEPICSVSGQIATQYCPETVVSTGSIVLITPGSYFSQFSDEVLLQGLTNYVRTFYSADTYTEFGSTGNYCTLHTAGGSSGGSAAISNNTLQWQAADLRDEILAYVQRGHLPDDVANELTEIGRAHV